MRAPEFFETTRLILRRPIAADAPAIFERYAADPDVTRYLAWPKHRTLEDTMAFLGFSDAAWNTSPGGPYLVEARRTGMLLGGTGFAFETAGQASVGYVFARDAWGQGYATEALQALVAIARQMGVSELHAFCHPDHKATIRVLEKSGFVRGPARIGQAEFPNLAPGEQVAVWNYTRDVAN